MAMRRSPMLAAAVVLALAVSLSYAGDAAESVAAPGLSIMPLGDSITVGEGGLTGDGYRADLWKQLRPGHPGLRFVGSQRAGSQAWQRYEGHSGWTIDRIRQPLGTWLYAAQPNLILLHIGTNDLRWTDAEAESAPARLGLLLDDIQRDVPGIPVLLATLVPATDPVIQQRVERYNAAMPDVIRDRPQVKLVRMDAVTPADIADDVHPNDHGYALMAQQWAGGVRAVANTVPEHLTYRAPVAAR
ncbi:SGNH hydrolase [Pseudonocardiaceae bacterium YIM PH 21723]|nr:SGNH hydrolase [Pseudonocardiaceae bacterium YIM PH 21723]